MEASYGLITDNLMDLSQRRLCMRAFSAASIL